jgi:ATP-binding cassette subfamily A (ABC1) protein 3
MVDKLRKVYEINGKVAVDQVSFGIEVGNVFGLLGVNGAGKTTTFKMLTGDIISTSGNAFIYSHNIATD